MNDELPQFTIEQEKLMLDRGLEAGVVRFNEKATHAHLKYTWIGGIVAKYKIYQELQKLNKFNHE